jgi:hypothetical protein
MRPRRRRALGAGLLALGVLNIGLVLTASAAHAQAPDRVGWWFQLQTAGLPAPLPVPTVPDGGLFVQQGPTEPLAYGALHFSAAPSGSSLVELTAAAGSTTIGSAVEACLVTKGWTKPAAAPGAWDARPTFDNPCTRGRISTDGAVVVFFLDQQFVKGGAIDVAIVPASGATPFSIAFAKPSDHALTAAPAAPSVGGLGSGSTIPRPSVTSPSPSAAGGGAGVVGGGGGRVHAAGGSGCGRGRAGPRGGDRAAGRRASGCRLRRSRPRRPRHGVAGRLRDHHRVVAHRDAANPPAAPRGRVGRRARPVGRHRIGAEGFVPGLEPRRRRRAVRPPPRRTPALVALSERRDRRHS